MPEKNKEIVVFSFYGGFVFSLIGRYWQYGLFFWFLGVVLFSFIFVLLFVSYLIIRRVVLFAYENYIHIFPKILREDEKKRIAEAAKQEKEKKQTGRKM